MKIYIGKNNNRHYEARSLSICINDAAKNIIMNFVCYEVTAENGDRIVSETSKEYHRSLIADNSTKVNPATGDYVPEGTEGAIGEWDYFSYISDNVPIKVTELKLNVINKNKHRLMPDGLSIEE